MKRLAVGVLLLAPVFVGCSSETLSSIVAPSVDTLSADGLKELVESGKDFVFLDVRESHELEQTGTLRNALHIPLGQLEARIQKIPKGKLVVAACERGVRAGRAAAMLKDRGFQDVKSTGLAEYRARGYELVRPSPSL